MNEPDDLTRDERDQALTRAPLAVTDLPGGGVRVERAGIVGVGATFQEAAADWGEKAAVTFVNH